MPAEPTLAVPRRWAASTPTDDPRVHLIMATAWVPASGFRPRAIVTRDATDQDLPGFQGDLIATFLEALGEAELEDADIYPVDGRPMSYLRFWHRNGGYDLMTEARTWLCDGQAWTVVSSAEHTDYPDFCDLFDDLTLQFEEPT